MSLLENEMNNEMVIIGADSVGELVKDFRETISWLLDHESDRKTRVKHIASLSVRLYKENEQEAIRFLNRELGQIKFVLNPDVDKRDKRPFIANHRTADLYASVYSAVKYAFSGSGYKFAAKANEPSFRDSGHVKVSVEEKVAKTANGKDSRKGTDNPHSAGKANLDAGKMPDPSEGTYSVSVSEYMELLADIEPTSKSELVIRLVSEMSDTDQKAIVNQLMKLVAA